DDDGRERSERDERGERERHSRGARRAAGRPRDAECPRSWSLLGFRSTEGRTSPLEKVMEDRWQHGERPEATRREARCGEDPHLAQEDLVRRLERDERRDRRGDGAEEARPRLAHALSDRGLRGGASGVKLERAARDVEHVVAPEPDEDGTAAERED